MRTAVLVAALALLPETREQGAVRPAFALCSRFRRVWFVLNDHTITCVDVEVA